MLKSLAKFVVALNGNMRTGAMAAGMASGVLLGLLPAGNLLWTLLFIFIFMLKIHLPSMALVMGIVKLFYPALDGFLDDIGYTILHLDALESIFTNLYNTPLVPFTKFNNTLVMGGLSIGLVALVPLWFVFLYLIKLYRSKIHAKIAGSKIVILFKQVPLIAKLGKYFSNVESSGSWS